MDRLDDLEAYVALRKKRPQFAQARIVGIERATALLDAKVSSVQAKLDEFGLEENLIQGLHKELRQCRDQKHELRIQSQRLSSITISSEPSNAQLVEEFWKLSGTPSVYSVTVNEPVVNIVLQARKVVDGVTYHLGDWRLSINVQDDTFETDQLESGALIDAYDHYHYADSFCFGSNTFLLRKLVQSGEYVIAIQTASLYMNNVNDDVIEAIEESYVRVKS